jgi:hypothetical protein
MANSDFVPLGLSEEPVSQIIGRQNRLQGLLISSLCLACVQGVLTYFSTSLGDHYDHIIRLEPIRVSPFGKKEDEQMYTICFKTRKGEGHISNICRHTDVLYVQHIISTEKTRQASFQD